MAFKLVSEDVVSDHKLDKLAIFHHIMLLMLFSGLIGAGMCAYHFLSRRLAKIEEKMRNRTENSNI